jgi:hypothetical protein
MDLRVSYGLNQAYLATPRAKSADKADSGLQSSGNAIIVQSANTDALPPSGTKLVRETQEDIPSGLRRTRTYEQADGRTFTRMEELTLTTQGARRSVIQQNPSGNITRYDEALEREPSGNFRRTQRFQDEAGEVSTTITPDYQVTDAFILTGGNTGTPLYNAPLFQPMRGTQLDLNT